MRLSAAVRRPVAAPVTAAVPGSTVPDGVGRAALGVFGWNALSRATGFLRVLAVGGAVGTTYLGNTYQSANLVSTVLFELLAAGLLSVPLVPAFVRLLDSQRRHEAERLAGTLVGVALLGLGVLALVLALAGHQVMRLLTAGVDDPGVREDQVRLGSFLLWFFLPQLLLYAVGAVSTALLNANRRFAAAALAPVANNLLVIATMATFMAVRGGGAPSLDLGLAARLVLAIGTTAGVLAMTAIPLLALRTSGMVLRPRLDLADPHVREVARAGRWVVLLLAGGQLLVAVTLVLANPVPGGVVAYQIAFTFFLLPFALVAQPIATVLHPRLSAHAGAERWDAFAGDVAGGIRHTLLFVLPAAAVLAVLGGPAIELARFGALDAAGATLVGRVVAAYALGLGGYAVFQLLARVCTAAGETRLAALAGLSVAAGGTVLMGAGAALASGEDRVVVVALAHSVAVSAGAFGLLRVLRRRLGADIGLREALVHGLTTAAAAGSVALVAVRLVGGQGRAAAAADLAVAFPAAGAVTGLLLFAFTPKGQRPAWPWRERAQ